LAADSLREERLDPPVPPPGCQGCGTADTAEWARRSARNTGDHKARVTSKAFGRHPARPTHDGDVDVLMALTKRTIASSAAASSDQTRRQVVGNSAPRLTKIVAAKSRQVPVLGLAVDVHS